MISIAVVDSGPLLAASNCADPDHARCVAVLERLDLRLVIPALCVAEVTYLLGRQQGSAVEAHFLRGLQGFDVRAPRGEEWAQAADLVERYADFPLGGTDASVVALAEALGTDLLVTLDRRHFTAIRGREGRPFRLLPGDT
jgi:predicted nucleic acid-binding protein